MQDRRAFIALGIQKPHVPFLAPDKYFDLYPQEALRYELDPPNLWETIPRDAISGRYKAFGFQLGVENESLRRRYMQAYHACISFVDAQLALVFDTVRNEGFWDNTVLLLTSDHGYHLGDHFLWGKVTLFDVGTRVPFIVRVPGKTQPGSQSHSIVELVDIYPTLLELAGLDAPDALQGRSLVPMLDDPIAPSGKRYAYTVVSRKSSLGRALRNQQWRYTKWPEGEELYNLEQDPHERRNLAQSVSHRQRLETFRDELRRQQAYASSKR